MKNAMFTMLLVLHWVFTEELASRWLGILVSSMDMTLSIPETRMCEIQDFMGSWNTLTAGTKSH